jgi:hypothetical protein|tara:strand:+ start:722 stop:1141 length:420 start_codon:yes stop_codon:yes gene_type:complete
MRKIKIKSGDVNVGEDFLSPHNHKEVGKWLKKGVSIRECYFKMDKKVSYNTIREIQLILKDRGVVKSKDDYMLKHKDVLECLESGMSVKESVEMCDKSDEVVRIVRRIFFDRVYLKTKDEERENEERRVINQTEWLDEI